MFVIIKYDLVMHFSSPSGVEGRHTKTVIGTEPRTQSHRYCDSVFTTKTSCQFMTGGTSQFPQELTGFAEFQELSRHISGFSRLTLAFAAATLNPRDGLCRKY